MLTTEATPEKTVLGSILTRGLKSMVIETCNVQGVKAEDIADDAPLIGGDGKLRLDSLDAVEIVCALNRVFGVKLEQAGEAQKVFRSFNVLADYVVANSDRERLEAFVRQHA